MSQRFRSRQRRKMFRGINNHIAVIASRHKKERIKAREEHKSEKVPPEILMTAEVMKELQRLRLKDRDLCDALSFMTVAIDPAQSDDTDDWELTDVRWRKRVDEMHAELQRLTDIVNTLPKCWRLNTKSELVQDVPIVLGGSYFFVCKIRGIRNVDVIGMDRLSKQQTSLNCVVWAFPPYLQGGRRLFPLELYLTREAAEAAIPNTMEEG